MCSAVPELESVTFSAEEWSLMDGTNKVLVHIKEVCDLLEGSKYPTISLMLPLVDFLACILKGGFEGVLKLTALPAQVQQLCQSLYDNIDTRAGSMFPQWVVASVALDMRLRNKLVVCQEMKVECEMALRVLYNVFDETKLYGSVEHEVVEQKEASIQQQSAPVKNLGDLLRSEVDCEDESVSTEIDRFLSIKKGIPYEDDPLLWWKAKETEFPKLARMARAYLCVPASTAAAERVFSYGSIIIQDHRHSLEIDRVARLMWMKKNMRLYKELSSKQ